MSKKKHDKKKHHAADSKKLVGKKVERGSKGAEPEVSEADYIEAMREKVAKKRAAREAAEKPKKKAGKIRVSDEVLEGIVIESDDAPGDGTGVEGGLATHTPDQVIAAAEKVLADSNASDGAVASAKAAKKKAKDAKGKTEALEREADQALPADFVLASESAGPPDFERNGRDQPMIVPKGGTKPEPYNRVTSWIDVLEDKTGLSNWGRRVVLAGAAADYEEKVADGEEAIVDEARASLRTFEKDLRQIEKRAAGKTEADLFGPGEREVAIEEAEKAHKKRLGELVERAFTIGEGRVAAERGTRIHHLTELHDTGQPLPEDITDEERADLDAYIEACKLAGLTVKSTEEKVVHDGYKIAGTLDRRYSYRRPGAPRSITVVGDIKTGSIEYGTLKIPMQITGYVQSEAYDVVTGERTSLGASKTIGLLIHLPAGRAECTIYEVDLTLGARGLKLAAEVRALRNESKRKGAAFTPHATLVLEAAEAKAGAAS